MIRFIVKRDGRKVSFNEDKISNAIRKALISSHPDDKSTSASEEQLIEKLTRQVVSEIEKENLQEPSVENTQDIIEKVLIQNEMAQEAKNFILYRQNRTNARIYNTELTKIYRDLT